VQSATSKSSISKSSISKSSISKSSISKSPLNGAQQQFTQDTHAGSVMSRRGDDQLSIAEIGLLFAAFSTLLCSMMLNVIVA